MADSSTTISSVGHCCNTETPHVTETVYPPHKSFMDILSKTYYQPIADPLLKNGKTRSKQLNKKQTKHYNPLKAYYNQHAQYLPEIQVGSNVAIHNAKTKLWDMYGVVTHISPHRRYYVKTASGRVLVQNRHFLRHRIPASIPPNVQQQLTPQHTVTPEPPSRPRHSTRPRHPPK